MVREEDVEPGGDAHFCPERGISWRRKWQPTPVFLPGESHGQRSLAGCSPWGRKESDTTEQNEEEEGLARSPIFSSAFGALQEAGFLEGQVYEVSGGPDKLTA